MMREGRIVQRGSIADLVERPAEPYVSQFVRAQRVPIKEALT
jgi:osmoprotectant transport system ATP-binding protein